MTQYRELPGWIEYEPCYYEPAPPAIVIRLPADVAGIVMHHPEFRFLGCASRLQGDWTEKKSDQTLWFEIRNPNAEDAREFIAFAHRIAGHLLKTEAP